MSLRFVYGRSGSGKTHLCLNEIKQRIECNTQNPLVFLVPEQFSFQAERLLSAALESRGILNTEVLSFQRMAFRIFNEVGGITFPHIHSAGKSMIIYRILDKLRGRFKVFSKSCDREGFVNTISTLITEFKRYGVVPEHLERAGQEFPEGSPLREKLLELNLIYSEFEKSLAERYRDSDDDLTMASKKLALSTRYDGAEIWIDGFTNFTPQEYGLIIELLKKARRVTITLCTDALDDLPSKEIDIFRPVKNAYKRLVRLAGENRINIEPIVYLAEEPPARFKGSTELAHLERNFYAYPCRIYNKETQDISLYSAMNTFSEAEAAARDIIRLCRDENLRFRDIAVVTRNLSGYEKLIEVIFTEYGIPYFIDRKVDINNHPLIRMVLSMMDIFIENWSYESVFRYLKTGLTGIDRISIDRLENYVLACGIRGSRWTSDKPWHMSPELITDEKTLERYGDTLDEINSIRFRVSEPLMEFREKTKGRRAASEFCGCLFDFLCNMGVPETIKASINEFQKSGRLVLANEYSQVWNTLMDVFDQVVEIMGDETIGIERFSKILRIGLEEYKIGTIPASLDQVLVGSVDRFRSHEIKAMYLLGVNDGVFPSTSAREGILSDQDRIALNHIGLELASDTKTQAFDEQYMVYRTLSTAGGFLRISWPISDSEGRTMRPSTIISRLRRLFPKIKESSNILPAASDMEELKLIARRNPAFKQMINSLRKKADGKKTLPVWEDVYRWFWEKEDWKQECERARAAFQFTNKAQRIAEEKIRALYGDPAVTSVSRLEKYTSCPFSFYVQYGLGAKERRIYRLSPPDIGTFMHAVIERFSKLVSKGDITWRSFNREWCNEKVAEIIDEMLDKMQGSGIAASTRYKALATRLKRVVARAVWLISEHIRRGSFEPVDYEAGFGEREKYPPITIELESGQRINLTGRIDRIDALKTEEGTYLRIIDYKSGAKDFRLSDVYYGLQIQLITYLDAIWESQSHDPDKKVLPGGMLYFRIDDPLIRGSNLTQEEIEIAIMKSLKMKGLLLADVKLIKEMDNTIEGSSLIIPATVNKGDVLGKNTSGATLDQFMLLRKYVRKLLKGLCTEIMKGNVDIKPYKKKGITNCKYCSFLPICRFDPALKDNTYKHLYDRKNDEIWELMDREGE